MGVVRPEETISYVESNLKTHNLREMAMKTLVLSILDVAVNDNWIPCTVVEHPEHCNSCEVTMKGTRGYEREIAFYTDKWRRESDEAAIDVVAWKEPSKPYQPKEN